MTLHLKAKILFITEGGLLQVGTEAHPYTGHATIEMYGHVRSIELPIYGTKCIALRNGTLDLHGKILIAADIVCADEYCTCGHKCTRTCRLMLRHYMTLSCTGRCYFCKYFKAE